MPHDILRMLRVRVTPDALAAGDCAIASSFVSYLGPFNKEFRELLLSRNLLAGCRRLGIPHTRDLAVSTFLVDDAEVGEWTLQVRHSLADILRFVIRNTKAALAAADRNVWHSENVGQR